MKGITYLGEKNVELLDHAMPQVKDGEVLIKIGYAGICGTDLNIFFGTHPRAKAPLIMGHEFSGVVQTDGKIFKKGDRVTAYPLISCGNCQPCKEGNAHVCNTLKLYGIDCDGGMAEYISLPEEKLFRLPDSMDLKMGAFIEPVAVTVHTVRETGYKVGENAIVFGAGTIGLSLALTLRNYGCKDLVVVENNIHRIKIAKELGLTIWNPITDDVEKLTSEYTNGNGFDFVYDCAGAQPVANMIFKVVKVKGVIVIVASYKHPPEMPLFMGMAKELVIKFTRVYRLKDFGIATKMCADNKDYEKIITHVFEKEDAKKGFELLTTKDNDGIKVMYKFGE